MLLEKFAELHRARIAHYLSLAKASIEDAERLGKMQWDKASATIERNTQLANAMSATRDITELIRLSRELIDFKLEEAWAYPLSIYRRTVEIQAELSRLIEESLTAYGVVIEQSMNSDTTATFATGELRSAINASETLLGQMTYTANEAAGLVGNNYTITPEPERRHPMA